MKRKENLDGMAQHAEGLKVVDGIRGELEKTQLGEGEKAAEESPLSQEAIGAVPAS